MSLYTTFPDVLKTRALSEKSQSTRVSGEKLVVSAWIIPQMHTFNLIKAAVKVICSTTAK